MWSQLSQPEIDSADPAYTDAQRRVLARLGEYAALIISPLNLRAQSAALHRCSPARIEVRVSTAASHILLVIAPEGDLAAEVYWLRVLAGARLPIPRLLAHDLSCALVPFTYTIESYVGGAPLSWLADEARARVAARQVGRALRRMHQLPAAGFGAPAPSGRWPNRSWAATLHAWAEQWGVWSRAADLLGAAGLAALRSATLEHPALACAQPAVLHGAPEPARVLVTVGEAVQVEALTQPGAIVGGDPLFDLAYATLPRHSAPFRQGVREGYCALAPLDAAHEQRLRRLGLLLLAADTLANGAENELAALPDTLAGELRAIGGGRRDAFVITTRGTQGTKDMGHFL